jgi:hypothetical protein
MTDIVAGPGGYENAPGVLFNQGLYDESADQKHKLGTVRRLEDGRCFVYCQDDGTAMTAGALIAKAVAVQACTVAALDAASVGATKISLTLTGTPTLNLYRDGWLIITATAGIGEMYKIRGNTVDDVPASGRCTFYLYDKLATALTTAGSTIDVIANAYDGVALCPANTNYDGTGTGTEKPLGVTLRSITASYYFWAQTKGLASLVMDIDAAAGAEDNEKMIVPGTTAGRGGTIVGTGIPGFHVIGEMVLAVDHTDAEAALVMLNI